MVQQQQQQQQHRMSIINIQLQKGVCQKSYTTDIMVIKSKNRVLGLWISKTENLLK